MWLLCSLYFIFVVVSGCCVVCGVCLCDLFEFVIFFFVLGVRCVVGCVCFFCCSWLLFRGWFGLLCRGLLVFFFVVVFFGVCVLFGCCVCCRVSRAILGSCFCVHSVFVVCFLCFWGFVWVLLGLVCRCGWGVVVVCSSRCVVLVLYLCVVCVCVCVCVCVVSLLRCGWFVFDVFFVLHVVRCVGRVLCVVCMFRVVSVVRD